MYSYGYRQLGYKPLAKNKSTRALVLISMLTDFNRLMMMVVSTTPLVRKGATATLTMAIT